MRAFLYTPVILGVTGLGAMAMFPALADHILGPAPASSSATCSSEGNPNCPIQMLMRAFRSSSQQDRKHDSKSPAATPISSSSSADLAMQMFDCCPISRSSLLRSEACTSDEPATETVTTEEPADALAAISASQAKPDSPELPQSND